MTTYRKFEAAIAEGADCAQLIELRNRLPIQDKEAAALQLRRLGCLDVEPEPTDPAGDREQRDLADHWFMYRVCAEDAGPHEPA